MDVARKVRKKRSRRKTSSKEEEEENEGRRVSSSLAVDAARVGASRRPQKRGAPLCWRGGGRRPIEAPARSRKYGAFAGPPADAKGAAAGEPSRAQIPAARRDPPPQTTRFRTHSRPGAEAAAERGGEKKKQGGPAREKTSRARCEAYNAALHRRYTFS
ncbi:unnamed protein product [Prorocentrum cordatum]|uniref:Uncharacterized protein n=1 Tax=Prorocentrum cordatum TaxID=2364126 RepID=A0ABN9R8J2_9DINO|nr:unnamed protein product [Polarella glacialis]